MDVMSALDFGRTVLMRLTTLSPPSAGCARDRYGWQTQKCRNLCIPHAFLEGKKAWKLTQEKVLLELKIRFAKRISGFSETRPSPRRPPHVVPLLARLLDHLVRLKQHQRRDREPEGLGCLQVDHQLRLHRLLHRQVGRLRPLEDLVH